MNVKEIIRVEINENLYRKKENNMSIYTELFVRILVFFVMTIILVLIEIVILKIHSSAAFCGDGGSGWALLAILLLSMYIVLTPITQEYLDLYFEEQRALEEQRTVPAEEESQMEKPITQFGIPQEDGSVKFHDTEWVEENGETNLVIRNVTPEEWDNLKPR